MAHTQQGKPSDCDIDKAEWHWLQQPKQSTIMATNSQRRQKSQKFSIQHIQHTQSCAKLCHVSCVMYHVSCVMFTKSVFLPRVVVEHLPGLDIPEALVHGDGH